MKTRIIATLILASLATVAHGQCSKSGLMDEGIFKDGALIKRTKTIKAELGTQFGFTYCASGLPDDDAVYEMEYEVSHPPMLVADGTIRTRFSRMRQVRSENGMINNGVGFTFNYEWELVPGVWTLDVRYKNNVVFSRQFVVN
jgi:hypothetical protein